MVPGVAPALVLTTLKSIPPSWTEHPPLKSSLNYGPPARVRPLAFLSPACLSRFALTYVLHTDQTKQKGKRRPPPGLDAHGGAAGLLFSGGVFVV